MLDTAYYYDPILYAIYIWVKRKLAILRWRITLCFSSSKFSIRMAQRSTVTDVEAIESPDRLFSKGSANIEWSNSKGSTSNTSFSLQILTFLVKAQNIVLQMFCFSSVIAYQRFKLDTTLTQWLFFTVYPFNTQYTLTYTYNIL